MTLGQKLKKLRTEKDLTQKDLADQLHVTFQTVSKWENDENEPDISTLRELAKLYSCSVDYLISEDEPTQVVVEEPKPEPVQEEKPKEEEQPVVKTIIIHQKELHVCERCKKDIPEDDLTTEQIMTRPSGRGHSAEYRTGYYHKDCLAKTRAERTAATQRAKIAKASRTAKLSFGWGIAAGVIALGAALGIMFGVTQIRQALNPGIIVLLSVIASYALFADLYCIISGSYIGDVFFTVAGWTIKFPGLIFSWDLGGFVWLIGMKILFAVIGFLLTVSLFVLAVSLSAFLAAVSFPFVLIHNIRTDYDDAL